MLGPFGPRLYITCVGCLRAWCMGVEIVGDKIKHTVRVKLCGIDHELMGWTAKCWLKDNQSDGALSAVCVAILRTLQ